MDVVYFIAFGSKTLWTAYEVWLDDGHDSWTQQAGHDYTEWLRVRECGPEHLEHFRKPDINNARWR